MWKKYLLLFRSKKTHENVETLGITIVIQYDVEKNSVDDNINYGILSVSYTDNTFNNLQA